MRLEIDKASMDVLGVANLEDISGGPTNCGDRSAAASLGGNPDDSTAGQRSAAFGGEEDLTMHFKLLRINGHPITMERELRTVNGVVHMVDGVLIPTA